jgi:hypothetical protein
MTKPELFHPEFPPCTDKTGLMAMKYCQSADQLLIRLPDPTSISLLSKIVPFPRSLL